MDKNISREAVKSVANTELSAKLAFCVGEAYASRLMNSGDLPKKVLIGKDTRASGDMIEAALSAGFCSKGVSVVSLGIVPSPALSYLITKYKVAGGVAISAGSEGSDYNGIMLFDSCARELSGEELEKILSDADSVTMPVPTNDGMGTVSRSHTALRDYVDFVKSTAKTDLSGLKIAIDTAFGAGYECAKLIFKELGADVEMLHNIPNGKNINEGCGLAHPEVIRNYVPSHKCHAGIVFDGACHDFAAVDETGKFLTDEQVKKICDSYCGHADVTDSNCGIVAALRFVCAFMLSGKKLSQI